MTALEASNLLVCAIRHLSASRREAGAYREVLHAAVHELADQNRKLQAARRQNTALIDEFRALRAQMAAERVALNRKLEAARQRNTALVEEVRALRSQVAAGRERRPAA